MRLTLKQATDIVNAFGPCTVLYECMGPEDLAERALDCADIRELIALNLRLESIAAERDGFWSEWADAKPAILRRLSLLGIQFE